jgi:uncharacterized membrane protein
MATTLTWQSRGRVVVAVGSSARRHVAWPNNVRQLFGTQPATPSMWPTVAEVTVVVTGILLVVSRWLRLLFPSPVAPERSGSPASAASWDALGRQGRADRILSELRRTGAFSRSVLVVATTTGTGFPDPAAMDPLA